MDLPGGFNLDILKRFGLEHNPEKWEQFFERAGEAIMVAVIRRLETELSEEQMGEFLRLFETSASDADKKAFLDTHVPRFRDVLLEETAHFKEAALARSHGSATPASPHIP
ncbi:MAG: hypothetical protein A3J10_04090 [Candidatus Sungbacteria bacterium RIFCSPLOWO2_02_FULL_54_10]|uniref:Uncharacterized protein n=2 Tax=Candidatus Sungiibacteriota TaxID=1817917 RepID=A0A1G2L769_9BACT|nr:MAG: hypothetical protein A2679_02565 [Candidatus Sungbacteria bacterium RIFCSPHIGHO2_01_FULL_54_26]OHA02899.1 MAG: hypothetical protein A3C92_01540 [Candidatus Sungbacteria bacterium RIFCSPHIGHO2_02_FULL_53_17]OHA07537.1 MAG: hypothetical protein A3B34_01130 [Candidatus Sungbacteria bacterium RIFCSPLOWO2_01_FULL_54_21]OHA13052.1 MAG: hypothetical protein A3J10_04090 [Candidatus Sungbacteria bacterium RIFCSPLOWO2_02_FULL_54_10]